MYSPIEYTASEDTFALLENMSPSLRENPDDYTSSAPAAPMKKRRSRKSEVVLPGESYANFRIKLALIRPPGYDPDEAPQMGSSEDVYRLLRSLSSEPVEVFVCICLDVQHRVLGVYEVARGGAASVEIHPVEVLRPVLLSGAINFIIAHNHPSGSSEPSLLDKELTTRIARAADALNCRILDHIVIGSNGHTSFATKGWL